jgi:hypothetical protein
MRISPDGAGNGVVTQVSLSDVQTGNASDATAGGSSTVVVTTDATGEFTQTTVVTVTDSEIGNNSQIAIDISTTDGSGLTTTVTIDSSMLDAAGLPDDARLAFGVVTNDPATGAPKSMILIVPNGSDTNGENTFNIVNVQVSETVNPASAFRNYAFSGTSGLSITSAFGGAVAIDVECSTRIVWLNAGSNVPPSFTGEIEANYGIIDPQGGGSAGTVAGLVGKITLVFENGQLIAQKDACGVEITDFDSYVREKIATQPELPEVTPVLSSTWQNTIVRESGLYVGYNYSRDSAFAQAFASVQREAEIQRQTVWRQEELRWRQKEPG